MDGRIDRAIAFAVQHMRDAVDRDGEVDLMAAVGADPADPAALAARAAAFKSIGEHDAALADLETARSIARSTAGETDAGVAAAMDAAIKEVKAARDRAVPMEGVAEGEEEVE